MTEQGGEALYQVAVRALCEFSAKRGDLDLRFTPSPSALEGIAGHTLVTSRRPAHYQREVALDGRYRHLQGARPGGWLRSAGELPGGNQDPPRRPRPATGQPPAPALGPGQGLRLAALRRTEAGGSRTGAGLPGGRQPEGDPLRRAGAGRRAAAVLREPVPGVSRLGRAGTGAPPAARPRTGRVTLPTPNSATASGNWRRRCTRPPPPVVA